MLSGNRRVEELKQEKLLREAAQAKEIAQWDVRWLVCVCAHVCVQTFCNCELSVCFVLILSLIENVIFFKRASLIIF